MYHYLFTEKKDIETKHYVPSSNLSINDVDAVGVLHEYVHVSHFAVQ